MKIDSQGTEYIGTVGKGSGQQHAGIQGQSNTQREKGTERMIIGTAAQTKFKGGRGRQGHQHRQSILGDGIRRCLIDRDIRIGTEQCNRIRGRRRGMGKEGKGLRRGRCKGG